MTKLATVSPLRTISSARVTRQGSPRAELDPRRAGRADLLRWCDEANGLIRELDLGQEDELYLAVCFAARVGIASTRHAALREADDPLEMARWLGRARDAARNTMNLMKDVLGHA